MKHKIIFIIVLSSLLIFTSCNQLTGEVVNWMTAEDTEDVAIKNHNLAGDGITIALPHSFERTGIEEFKKKLSIIASKEAIAEETRRIHILENMEGNFYLFYDPLYQATYTLNAIPYTPFNKADAQMLHNIFLQGLRNSADELGTEYEKITAKYSGDRDQQFFRTIYRMSQPANDLEWYSTVYFVSANNKTVIIQLTTGFQIDFNPFVAKMKL